MVAQKKFKLYAARCDRSQSAPCSCYFVCVNMRSLHKRQCPNIGVMLIHSVEDHMHFYFSMLCEMRYCHLKSDGSMIHCLVFVEFQSFRASETA